MNHFQETEKQKQNKSQQIKTYKNENFERSEQKVKSEP